MQRHLLFLSTCLGLGAKNTLHFDMLSENGIPSMSSISGNIQAPSLSDLGGSLGDKAASINQGPNSAYSNYQGSLQPAGPVMNPFKTYQDLLVQNGIPQLQKTSESLQGNVNDLENSINRVTPNVTANTGNSLVTEGQREGMVQNQTGQLNLQLDPLMRGLSSVNNSLTTQEQNIGNEVSALGQNNQMLSNAGALGVSVAQDNAARQMTGYTQDSENVLQGLLKKMDITGNLDTAEWTTLSNLAQKKLEYQNNLQQIVAQQHYMQLQPGNTLLNTYTGKSQYIP